MKTIREIKKMIKDIRDSGNKINRLQNEGGEGYDYTQHEKIAELEKKLEELEKIQLLKDWDLEKTMEKRNIWNASIKKLKEINVKMIIKLEEELGFKMFDLKNAIKRHNI